LTPGLFSTNLLRVNVSFFALKTNPAPNRGLFQTALLATLLLCGSNLPAQNLLSVTSTTDGNGLFSYTFSLGSDPYVWGLDTNGQVIIPSHGILDIAGPPGWAATIDTNDIITWQPTSGRVFLGQPTLIFSVHSSYTNAVSYDQMQEPYQMGIVAGVAYTLPDHQALAGGFQWFSFVGPEVPEPSTISLLPLAAVSCGLLRSLRFLRVKQGNKAL